MSKFEMPDILAEFLGGHYKENADENCVQFLQSAESRDVVRKISDAFIAFLEEVAEKDGFYFPIPKAGWYGIPVPQTITWRIGNFVWKYTYVWTQNGAYSALARTVSEELRIFERRIFKKKEKTFWGSSLGKSVSKYFPNSVAKRLQTYRIHEFPDMVFVMRFRQLTSSRDLWPAAERTQLFLVELNDNYSQELHQVLYALTDKASEVWRLKKGTWSRWVRLR